MPKIIYICDGKACPKCDPELCKHTSNIEHAISFSLEGNMWVEKENNAAKVKELKAKVEELQKELACRPLYVNSSHNMIC